MMIKCGLRGDYKKKNSNFWVPLFFYSSVWFSPHKRMEEHRLYMYVCEYCLWSRDFSSVYYMEFITFSYMHIFLLYSPPLSLIEIFKHNYTTIMLLFYGLNYLYFQNPLLVYSLFKSTDPSYFSLYP